MEITVNQQDYCKFNVHVEADRQVVLAKKDQVVLKFKDQHVPGFRPKKASLSAIEMHYRKEISEITRNELAEDAYNTAITEHDIKPFGNPQFTFANIVDSKFVCEFSINAHPSFELKQYKGFEIPKPAESMTTEEFTQKILQDLRVRFGSTEPYKDGDFIQMGDNVVLDYSATSNGEPIEALNASGEVVSIGKTPIDGFDSSLLGMNIGEEREFVVNIPETSQVKDLAGKPVAFKAKLLMGSKTTPASLDDELAKKFGADNFDALLAQVSAAASNRMSELSTAAIINQISHRLVDNHDFQIPVWIATTEAQMKARGQNKDWEKLTDEEREVFVKAAEDSIKLSLVLEKVRNAEPDAQLTDEEAFNAAKSSISKMSGDATQVMQKVMSNGQLPLLMNHVRDEYTLLFIKKTCTIVE
jgi:trigger factor